jgi:hypothetical protein
MIPTKGSHMTRVTILSLLAWSVTACAEDPVRPDPDPDPDPIEDPCPDDPTKQCVNVPDEIAADTTWTADKVYVIPNFQKTFVRKPATLTIQPGTEIRGGKSSVMTIARGAKIIAEGTVQQPIVFTSAQAPGSKTPGYWGGLLIMGYASHNTNVLSTPASGEALFEAFSNADGDSAKFGSPLGMDIANDNSGVLKYVRIEFGGYNFVADREFNNLTLCGVGSGTTIDFVQVHGGQDDGIELFGGTVNLKHIVSSQNEDDGFDTDNGWRGKAQYVIVQNVAHRTGAVLEATNGYETDNHALSASFDAAPRTQPTIVNATLIGDHGYTEQASWAGVFRRGTSGHYLNHIWIGFPRGPEFRDAQTKAQLDAGNLTIAYSMFFNNDNNPTNLPAPATSGDIIEADYIRTTEAVAAGRPDPHNMFNVSPAMATGATSRTTPDFKPAPGSAALDPANAVPASDSRIADPFFDKTNFVGAIGPVDWTAGWTKYPQN